MVRVRYFASLREQLGRASDVIDCDPDFTVGQIWAQATGNRPLLANTLIAVNHEYCTRDRKVRAGDEVAFFPPVTGG